MFSIRTLILISNFNYAHHKHLRGITFRLKLKLLLESSKHFRADWNLLLRLYTDREIGENDREMRKTKSV